MATVNEGKKKMVERRGGERRFVPVDEISVTAEEEFNIEKWRLQAEKKMIRQEYERKEKQVEIREKM